MGSKTRRNNLWAALPLDKRQVQADIRSHLIHRPARDIIPPLGGPQCSPVTVDLARFTPLQRSWSIGTQCRLPDNVHDHGQPRASATIAFFIPRCLAIFMAQALSQDHLVVRVSMLWAAS